MKLMSAEGIPNHDTLDVGLEYYATYYSMTMSEM